MTHSMEDYVEVAERIAAFYAKYPEGSHQGWWEERTIGDQTLIVYRSTVYRTADDPRPSVAFAAEPFPGRTPFTRGSELQNAETSAVGRALALLGFKVKRSIASADEIRAARERQPETNGKPEAIDAERVKAIHAAMHGLTYQQIDLALGAAGIDALRARSRKAAQERIASLTVAQADALEAELG